MKVKKIIIFFPIFSKGGLEKVANALVSHFNNYELKIYFITFKKNKYLNFKNKNVKILCSKSASKKKSTSSFKKIFYCLKILQKLLKINNPENTNILSIQNSACAIILAKFYNYKIVVHNGAPLSSFLYLKNIFKSFFVFIFKIISYNFADKIIVNSNANGNSLSKFILNKKKVIKIHNPINLNKKPFITAKKKQILTVCRLVHEKGIHVLINAFHKINDPELKLIIVGDGAYKKNLINLVFHLNLKKKLYSLGGLKILINIIPNHLYSFYHLSLKDLEMSWLKL
jgi:glycosyltransferase involved in cell wall biosynthesis